MIEACPRIRIQMLHLVFLSPGKLEWRETPDARLQGDDEAVVRPLVIGRCDLDRLFLAGHVPLASGEPIGHEIIGEVIDLGERAGRHFTLGQRVIVAAQISCGTCAACRRGATGRCSSVPFGASYGMGREGNHGGALSERIRVPFAASMMVPLPAGADATHMIGLADMATDAWRAVGPQLSARPAARVLVTSGPCPVIALYAAGLAVSLGASLVDYVDADEARCTIARRYGAVTFRSITEADGPYDIIVDGAFDAATFVASVDRCAPDALITSVAPPLTPPALPMQNLYHKGITWRLARPDCRAGHAGALDACAHRDFRPELVGPKIYSFREAIDAWLDPALYIAVSA